VLRETASKPKNVASQSAVLEKGGGKSLC